MNFDDDAGNEAYDLRHQGSKQDCDKHDERHANDGTDAGNDVLEHGVVMRDHRTEEEQEDHPDKGDDRQHGNDACLGKSHEVGKAQ